MLNFIRKIAIKNYKKESEDLISVCSNLDKEQLADFFICSVWTRAGMQSEGLLKINDGQRNTLPYLCAYPIMIAEFEKIIKAFRKKGLNTEATCMLFWVHTLRGLLYDPEMKNEFDRLWQLLMTTKDLWNKYLDKFYNEDKDKLNPKLLNDTVVLAKEILNNLPPKQSWEYK